MDTKMINIYFLYVFTVYETYFRYFENFYYGIDKVIANFFLFSILRQVCTFREN